MQKIDLNNLSSIYFIGEIGINHNADLQIVKKLIDGSFACGWDSVKFQKRNPEKSTPQEQRDVLRKTPWGEMRYIDYKHKIELGKEEYDFIDSYCKQKPLSWSASPWDYDSVDFLLGYDLPYIKIPSALNTNFELVEYICKTGIPVIASTGMSSLEETDKLVNLLNKNSNNFALLHTNSAYPCSHDDLNLSLIPFMKERYQCTIGYSGHEEDVEPSVIAATLGAEIIERHITIDRNLWGTDQKNSLEINGMFTLKKRCETINRVMGTPVKKVQDSEIPFMKKLKNTDLKDDRK
jgi:N-acetylneuraminate synthase